MGVLLKMESHKLLAIDAYFKHSGHSLDESQSTVDDIQTIIDKCPAASATPVILCDANVHLGPGAGVMTSLRYLPKPSWVMPRTTGTSILGTLANATMVGDG